MSARTHTHIKTHKMPRCLKMHLQIWKQLPVNYIFCQAFEYIDHELVSNNEYVCGMRKLIGTGAV